MTQKLGMAAVILLAASFTGPAFAQSADLYKSKCAMCHGADGKGDTPAGKKMGARDFHLPEVAKETDQQMFDLTKNGKAKMPAYKDKLTDAQIKDLVKHIRTLK